MFGFLARLASGAVAPLVDRLSASAASLAKKLALFAVAGICFLVTLVALTVAFDLWVSSMAGAIAGALAVAGVYASVGVLAVVGATIGFGRGRRVPEPSPQESAAAQASAERGAQIDRFTAPLLGVLASLGLRREQLAVVAGAAVAKQLKPLPLVGLAIFAGFLVGRLWKGIDALASNDLIATVLGLIGIGQGGRADQAEDQAA